jgi:NAD+ kinase
LVRLSKSKKTLEKIAMKVKLADELINIPPSARLILTTLEYEGDLTQNELTKKTMLPDRTTRQALSILLEKGIIKRRSSLRDVRQKIYYVI